jgi:hypothetical protein
VGAAAERERRRLEVASQRGYVHQQVLLASCSKQCNSLYLRPGRIQTVALDTADEVVHSAQTVNAEVSQTIQWFTEGRMDPR